MNASLIAELLERDHRRLDDLFGRFLASEDREAAVEAIGAFDDALRRHTALEEEHAFPSHEGTLAAPPVESERERLFRELRLEHVQLRELSGMIVRALAGGDPRAARALAPGLARRWEAHTRREEREVLPILHEALDEFHAAALRRELGSGGGFGVIR